MTKKALVESYGEIDPALVELLELSISSAGATFRRDPSAARMHPASDLSFTWTPEILDIASGTRRKRALLPEYVEFGVGRLGGGETRFVLLKLAPELETPQAVIELSKDGRFLKTLGGDFQSAMRNLAQLTQHSLSRPAGDANIRSFLGSPISAAEAPSFETTLNTFVPGGYTYYDSTVAPVGVMAPQDSFFPSPLKTEDSLADIRGALENDAYGIALLWAHEAWWNKPQLRPELRGPLARCYRNLDREAFADAIANNQAGMG